MQKKFYIHFLFFFLITLIFSFYFFNFVISSDTKTFINFSKNLNFYEITTQKLLYLTTSLFFKFILLFSHWEIIFKIFNILIFFLIINNCFLILKINNIIFKNNLEIIYFFCLFLFNFNFFQWVNYGLTDLYLIFFITLSVLFCFKKKYFYILPIIFICTFIKPQSIFIYFIFSFFLLTKIQNLYLRFLFIIVSFYFCIYVSSILYQNINFFSFLKIVNQVFFVINSGIIVHDRIIFSGDEIYLDYLRRLIYFFSFYFDNYSFKHKLYNSIFFSFIILPILYVYFFKKLDFFEEIFSKHILIFIFFIIFFCVITFLDYDLRYRSYSYPFLNILNFFCLKKILQKNKIF